MRLPRKSERKKAFGSLTSNARIYASHDELSGETLINPVAKMKVMIVYHACWICRAMRNVINQNERFAVCAETDSARAAIPLFEQHQPKIVVVDLLLRQGHGISLIKSLIKLCPAVLILVLSFDDGMINISRALRAGAVGYLTAEDGDLELPIALEAIVAGTYYVSKSLWSVVLKSFGHNGLSSTRAGANLLTDRELEVFTLIGRGDRI
jgi:two-component system response regulator DegU